MYKNMYKDINIDITIDVESKLKKIYEGKTFSDRLVVVTELFQNSQRANGKNVYIELGEGKLIFKDDGCGSKTPADILTLDKSNWETTDEGFGIGLWSWLAVSDVEGIEIKSYNWEAKLVTKDIFENKILSAKVSFFPENMTKGFEVAIISEFFSSNMVEVKNRIISDGEMQLFNVYLNGDLIPKKDLHSDIKGMEFSKCFSNRYFEATFAPARWGHINNYYERRKVDNFYPTDYLEGVIEIKKNALTLQEPDRKNIIRDDKRYDFIKRVEECRKEVYLDIVKTGDSKVIDIYANEIDSVLRVEDYEKYLLVDDLIVEIEEETRNVGEINPIGKFNSFKKLVELIDSMNNTTQLSLTDNISEEEQQENIERLLNISSTSYKWVKTDEREDSISKDLETEPITEEVLDTSSTLNIGGVVYRKVNVSDFREIFQEDDEEIISSITVKTTKKNKKQDTLRSVLKKTNRKVWVKASEIDEYSELISKVEYYGVKVFIAKNILHENVFKENRISYITEIESGIQKTNIKWDIELKTKKEERFIELLQPICYYYNLPMNTFKIGNLKLMIETILDEKVINREIIENRKDSIKIYGVTDGSDIILDRRALGLQRFNLSGNNIGVNEFKALIATMKTIAHELSHLLYGTEDNTKEHRQTEDRIYEELVNLYLAI